MKYLIHAVIILCFGGLMLSCVNRPQLGVNVSPMPHVEIQHYMGTWHEIARLPNKYEQGLDRITATYSLKRNGRVSVRNSGFNAQNDCVYVCGLAYIPNKDVQGHLRVSFVFPYIWFYGNYNILYVNKAYDLALVGGSNANQLWILSKRTAISEAEKQDVLGMARARGFDTSKLIWPVVTKL